MFLLGHLVTDYKNVKCHSGKMIGKPIYQLDKVCTVPKYRAAVDYTPRLRASRNLPRCTANGDTYGQ